MKGKIMSRAITASELKLEFINTIRSLCEHWATVDDLATIDRVEGVATGILSLLNGVNASMCGFDIVARPHHSDKEYSIERGENWVEDGTVINNNMSYMLNSTNRQKS